VLQCVAVCCNTLQHTATRCNMEECCVLVLIPDRGLRYYWRNRRWQHTSHTHTATHTHFTTLQCTARCCSVPQHIATRCSTLQHTERHFNTVAYCNARTHTPHLSRIDGQEANQIGRYLSLSLCAYTHVYMYMHIYMFIHRIILYTNIHTYIYIYIYMYMYVCM